MTQSGWLTNVNVRNRLGLALLGTVAVTSLYAVGILDNPWIDLFTIPSGFDEAVLARNRFLLLLMAPVLGYFLAPRIRWLRDSLVIFTVVCFMVSGLDLLLHLPKPKGETQLSAWWLPQLPWIWRFDPSLSIRGDSYGDLAGRKHDPRLREPRTVVFQTDKAGFRNSHHGERIDLLILGDSFGAGVGTTQERIFPSLLEADYGRHVYNLSLPGGPHHEYINFLIESPSMAFYPNARLVWLLFMGNDLHDSYRAIWDPTKLDWQEGIQTWVTRYKNFRNRSPLRRMIVFVRKRLFGDEHEQMVIQRELPNGQPILFYGLYEHDVNLSKALVEQHPHFPMLERTMLELRKRTLERGLELTVVLIPAKEEVYRWILNQRDRRPEDTNPSGFAFAVLDACRRTQIRCLDSKPNIMREAYRLFDSSGELLYWRDDTHINERGHALMAAFVAREILSSSDHASPPSGK